MGCAGRFAVSLTSARGTGTPAGPWSLVSGFATGTPAVPATGPAAGGAATWGRATRRSRASSWGCGARSPRWVRPAARVAERAGRRRRPQAGRQGRARSRAARRSWWRQAASRPVSSPLPQGATHAGPRSRSYARSTRRRRSAPTRRERRPSRWCAARGARVDRIRGAGTTEGAPTRGSPDRSRCQAEDLRRRRARRRGAVRPSRGSSCDGMGARAPAVRAISCCALMTACRRARSAAKTVVSRWPSSRSSNVGGVIRRSTFCRSAWSEAARSYRPDGLRRGGLHDDGPQVVGGVRQSGQPGRRQRSRRERASGSRTWWRCPARSAAASTASQSMTPTAKRSDRASTALPDACSGDMYAACPALVGIVARRAGASARIRSRAASASPCWSRRRCAG